MTPRLLQLTALRAIVDALIQDELNASPQMTEQGICPTCGAGEGLQKNTSTLDGVKRRLCTQCGTERVVP